MTAFALEAKHVEAATLCLHHLKEGYYRKVILLFSLLSKLHIFKHMRKRGIAPPILALA
jgi:hypothetical protein